MNPPPAEGRNGKRLKKASKEGVENAVGPGGDDPSSKFKAELDAMVEAQDKAALIRQKNFDEKADARTKVLLDALKPSSARPSTLRLRVEFDKRKKLISVDTNMAIEEVKEKVMSAFSIALEDGVSLFVDGYEVEDTFGFRDNDQVVVKEVYTEQ